MGSSAPPCSRPKLADFALQALHLVAPEGRHSIVHLFFTIQPLHLLQKQRKTCRAYKHCIYQSRTRKELQCSSENVHSMPSNACVPKYAYVFGRYTLHKPNYFRLVVSVMSILVAPQHNLVGKTSLRWGAVQLKLPNLASIIHVHFCNWRLAASSALFAYFALWRLLLHYLLFMHMAPN